MNGNPEHNRIEVGETVLDATLITPALPAGRRPPPPTPPRGLEAIWPMELIVGIRERLARKDAVWEKTTRWRAA